MPRQPKTRQKKTHFKNILTFNVDYAPVTISQHVSERTGMSVVIVDREGPLVDGLFVLGTEILDDSGAPHTLEHLVFSGSRNYQYQGLLSHLSSRAYLDTNAWTADDHTAYSMQGAGWEGFSQILPVYLDHLISPTLTDESCYTEVHHIDGEGNDAGVVYSEMQGRENTAQDIAELVAKRIFYPEGCGYRYETGGLMENLRVLTADRIREFHKEMYQPKNMCLIFVGEVDQDDLFSILDKFETTILDVVPPLSAPFRRPWIDSPQPPPLAKSVTKTVYFPDEDESIGEVQVKFLGPHCCSVLETTALSTLTTFLTGSTVAVLANILIEEEELASYVSIYEEPRPRSAVSIDISGVATEKLAHVEKRMFEILRDVTDNPLDMDYMLDCIKRERRQLKSYAENSSDIWTRSIATDFVYGDRDGSTLVRSLRSLENYDVLETWTDKQWRIFLSKWITDAPHVTLHNTPSNAMVEEIKSVEEARVSARRKDLGPDALAKLASKLQAATAKNNPSIPDSLFDRFPMPGVESIHLIETTTARSGFAKALGTKSTNIQSIIDQSASNNPLFIHFQHVTSNFVRIQILLGASTVATEHRLLLPLLMESFFDTPIVKDGERIEFEEVVKQLDQETISYSFGSGAVLSSPEGLMIEFQVEPDKYSTCVEWIRALMFDGIFDEARLKSVVAKNLAGIAEWLREGEEMVTAVDIMIHRGNNSTYKAQSTLAKEPYFKRLKYLLAKEPGTVISQLEALRKSLFASENMRIFVTADIEKLPSPVAAWDPFVKALGEPKPPLPLVKGTECRSADGQKPGDRGAVVIPMAALDSSFMLSVGKGLESVHDRPHPALSVAIAFLNSIEGPLWKSVRGEGLAYNARFISRISAGAVIMDILKSPDPYRAFIAARDVLISYIDGTSKLEPRDLESGVSSIVLDEAQEQETPMEAAKSSFVNSVVRDLPPDYNQQYMKRVRAITPAEVREVMKKILLPLFVPGTANIIMTCANIMQEGSVKNFEELGFKTQVKALSDFKENYGLEPLEGEEDDNDESGEDDSGEDESEEEEREMRELEM
ncbi:zinc metalloprotease [Amylocarpus encephaloides]|uniref:Zinc metalloprotease n=1 Tax=Amylocarpus encephaloides TaxID=45428 RepID=A0A9P8C6G6_9HELO|nr:zinc metalloprotease [Amylocarpus encephaloides]